MGFPLNSTQFLSSHVYVPCCTSTLVPAGALASGAIRSSALVSVVGSVRSGGGARRTVVVVVGPATLLAGLAGADETGAWAGRV